MKKLLLIAVCSLFKVEVSSIYHMNEITKEDFYDNEIIKLVAEVSNEETCEILFKNDVITRVSDNITCSWITQYVDNFNPEVGSWRQKYYVNSEFVIKNDPSAVFLLIGGEAPILVNSIIENTTLVRYAKEHNALIFQLEHRYYGNSCPMNDLSVDNLKYLSSEQCLEDISNFISNMTSKYSLSKETKWIAFGGSYAGSLTAWLRLKHPDKVHGAITASAPLDAKLDFVEYFQVVWKVLDTFNSACSRSIIQALDQMNQLLGTKEGISFIEDRFNFCYDTKYGIDATNIINYILSNISFLVQYGYAEDAEDLCRVMDENLVSPLEGLAIYSEQGCLANSYNKTLERKTGLDCSFYSYLRSWNYQTCTEFGWYQIAQHLPLGYYLQICKDLFGSDFTPEKIMKGIDHTNQVYGGLAINVTNTVFVNGGNDPWYPLGLVENPNINMFFIEGTSHRQFLNEENETDPPELKEARKQVNDILKNWLK